MSEIDVTKCRFYLDDGSCCSHDTDCTKCIHCYCDWKVHQEQLYRYKQVVKEIKEIAEKIDDSCGCVYGDYNCDNCSSLEQKTVCTYKVKKLIIQKCEDANK